MFQNEFNLIPILYEDKDYTKPLEPGPDPAFISCQVCVPGSSPQRSYGNGNILNKQKKKTIST